MKLFVEEEEREIRSFPSRVEEKKQLDEKVTVAAFVEGRRW